jgi:DNA-binding IscR family transcriptional regulator
MPEPLGRDAATDVLRALAAYHTRAGRAPSIQELSDAMDMPRTTLYHRLTVLKRAGLLRWEPGMPRTLILTRPGRRLLAGTPRKTPDTPEVPSA